MAGQRGHDGVLCKNDIACYLAPDGKTAIVHTPALARACGLTPLCPDKPAYLVDEYNKCIVQVQVGNDFALSNPTVWAERGEYGFAMTEDGDAYIPDCLLYIYVDGEKKIQSSFMTVPHACWKLAK